MPTIDHYRLTPNFVINFSGGETSAFMLRQVLDSYGGKLPSGGKVLFFNTGLEHDKTLEFVRRVQESWSVDVTWLEYVAPKEFEIVSFDTASRNGEPFRRLIDIKGYPPTPVNRVCTSNLKMRTGYAYLRSIGWDEWDVALGLRADEPRRATRVKADYAAENPVVPMYHAGHSLKDVEEFWSGYEWRLEIPRWLGNCCGCFLKSAGRLGVIASDHPETLEWWAKTEEEIGKPFRLDRPSYRQMLTQVSVQGRLFEQEDLDADTIPCTCTE